MGVTFIKTFTNFDIKLLNDSKEQVEECQKVIRLQALPEPIKETMVKMIEFEKEDRLSSYELYCKLW